MPNRSTPINLHERMTFFEGHTYWLNCLNNTRRHTIIIPVSIRLNDLPDEFGFADESNETEIAIDWSGHSTKSEPDLNRLQLSSNHNESLEASIYLRSEHNPIHVEKLELTAIAKEFFHLKGRIKIELYDEENYKSLFFDVSRNIANEGMRGDITAKAQKTKIFGSWIKRLLPKSKCL